MHYFYPNLTRNATSKLDMAYEYLMHQTGPLSSHSGTMDFVNVNDPKTKCHYILYIMNSIDREDTSLVSPLVNGFALGDRFKKQLKDVFEGIDSILIASVLLIPKSIGKIKLRCENSNEQAKIYLNFFDIEDDLNVMTKVR